MSAVRFEPLPVSETAEGKPRLTGVEIELGGIDEATCAKICADLLGGEIKQVDTAIWHVEETEIGKLKVYLDTALRHSEQSSLRDAAQARAR